MPILKKKNILEYKSDVDLEEDVELSEEIEELEEFVNGMGASISGDKPSANNSEIETAPQATSDDHQQSAIQPNRYLYNVDGQAARGGVDGTIGVMESYNIAKNKMISLLEDAKGPQLGSHTTMTDYNDNGVVDINELPSNVARKLTDLVDGVINNNLSDNEIQIILKFINDKINA